MERAARDGAIDPLHERAVLALGGGVVVALDGCSETLRQRLDRRAVAQVLQALLARDADPLLLLSDVGHVRKKCPVSRAAAWYQSHVSRSGPEGRVSCERC